MTDSAATVLVTGGAGFIGCALSQRLASAFGRWVVFDSLHPQVHASSTRPTELHEAAELVVAEVTDPLAWDALLADVKPDIVVHLAAETGTAQSLHEASRHAQVNVVGTTTMLDALGRSNLVPSHFLLSSSRAVYGEGAWQNEEGETVMPGQRSHAQLERREWDFAGCEPLPSTVSQTWPTPTSVYGATKLAQENILSAWTGAHDSRLTALRLQNVYGPGQSLINSYTGIVSLFSQWAKAGKSIPIYEDGLITRDFVFIDDVVDAFAAAVARRPAASPARYDVGSGVETTILRLAEIIADYHGAPTPHVVGEYRDGDVRFAATLVEPTTTALGWLPQTSVEDGIAQLQAWIAAQEH